MLRSLIPNILSYKKYILFIKVTLIVKVILFVNTLFALNTEPKFEQAYNIIPGSTIQAYKYRFANGLQLFVVPDKRNPVATIH